MLTVGSLFAGIGGLDLGLERTGYFKTIWFSEIDDYASAVLRKHWPNVPNHGDITRIDWNGIERPDLLCGGFPCQDISIAGKGKGINGERSGLWKEFHRAIEATKPKWVIIENSPELINRGLGQVLQDIRASGYTPFRPLLLEVAQIGARHRRERLFIVAHADVRGSDNGDTIGQGGQVLSDGGGNCEKDKQEWNERKCGIDANAPATADINSFGKQRNVAQEIFGQCGFSWWNDAGEFEDIRRGQHLLKPLVCRRIYGLSEGMDRIKCLGNAVVPQVAQVIGELIAEYEGLNK